MDFLGIEKLKAEIVTKLNALYVELGTERVKVGAAIAAMTGAPPPGDDAAQQAEVAALTSDVQTSADDLAQSVQDSQHS